MLFTDTTFIGIDVAAGGKPFVYAALDASRRLAASGRATLDELLAFLGGQAAAYVAINAPAQPAQGLMRKDEVRSRLVPPPPSGRWEDLRVVEYQMRQMGVSVPATAKSPDQCPAWMRRGFGLYRALQKMGFQPFPVEQGTYQWLEVNSEAVYFQLLGQRALKRRTLEGRLQRQLVLYDQGMGIHNPMDFFEEITQYRLLKGILPLDRVYRSDTLEALAAAYVAYLAGTRPETVMRLGDASEGQVVLPGPALRSR